MLLAVVFGDNGVLPFAAAMTIAGVSSIGLLRWSGRSSHSLGSREALLLVTVIWFSISLFGSIPFYLSPQFGSFTDAFFESASGFTTTGSTILRDVSLLDPSLQFWRHFTHWVGGMGVVVLGIAILPLVGQGGM